MTCERLEVPGMQTVIVCRERRKGYKVARCQFCGSKAAVECDWKCDRPKKISHRELAESDVVVTQQKKYRLPVQGLQRFIGRFRVDRQAKQVTADLDSRRDLPIVRYEVTAYGLIFPDKKGWLYYAMGDDQIAVLRPGTCDNACCELHSRELAPNIHHCQEHWQSWQEVA